MGDNAQIDECGVCCNCDENTDDCTKNSFNQYNSPDEYGGNVTVAIVTVLQTHLLMIISYSM